MAGRHDGADNASQPALQVIVLGSGGGPQENNVTAFLVRSVRSGWARGSVVALDAGVHLSAITRILEDTQPPGLGSRTNPLPHILDSGPFAGMEIRSAYASTNAAHVTRHLIDTYLITHPHLDHISGFVINTAGLPGTRPKRIAGLPSTISAFKSHIFNNVIWPNLSDENNGAGLVTYTRLVEGGSPALGEGDGKGYLEISDDLTVKVLSVSHGHCMEKHIHRGSACSSRFGSVDVSSVASPRVPQVGNAGAAASSGPSPSSLFRSTAGIGISSALGPERESMCVYDSSAYFLRDAVGGREVLMFGDVEPDSLSLSPRNLGVWQEAAPRVAGGSLTAVFIECSYDDGQADDRLFGHLTPRYVVQELRVLAAEVVAARAQAQAQDSVPVGKRKASVAEPNKKRKRGLDEEDEGARYAGRRAEWGSARPVRVVVTEATALADDDDMPVSPKSTQPQRRNSGGSGSGSGSGSSPLPSEHEGCFDTHHAATADLTIRGYESSTTASPPPLATALPTNAAVPAAKATAAEASAYPLRGLTVVVIHVKDRLDGDDGGSDEDPAAAGDAILAQLRGHEREASLGCEFVVSRPGQSFFF
ncbi:cAMP phosphodiesterases class-II-domain-containing protein [Durotheca rogersii]|uniref:cAMP phosphodiesterases class-II-domain-containing protein n=1 Tax=Durotheca rogersii TaxID=419775 RepID=UPI0022209C36|nr:cAMP phosphodiesterases class-II-domain-containing protein [Durotheca rogersii]KAI5864540.1 cAMP phosphodiesterases class-II-domain-containing protein [Durotheca rogersii]